MKSLVGDDDVTDRTAAILDFYQEHHLQHDPGLAQLSEFGHAEIPLASGTIARESIQPRPHPA